MFVPAPSRKIWVAPAPLFPTLSVEAVILFAVSLKYNELSPPPKRSVLEDTLKLPPDKEAVKEAKPERSVVEAIPCSRTPFPIPALKTPFALLITKAPPPLTVSKVFARPVVLLPTLKSPLIESV
jgi:hypothetical protein